MASDPPPRPGAELADRPLGPRPDRPFAAPQVPVLGPRGGPGAWAEYLALRAVQRTLLHAPASARRVLVEGLARLLRAVDRRHARHARDFLATALPQRSEREREALVLQTYRHLLRLAYESEGAAARLAGRPLGAHFRLELGEEARALIASGRGFLVATPHVGNWEVSAWAFGALGAGPLYAVGKPPRNRPLARHYQRARERSGIRLLPRRGAMKDIPRLIEGGGAVLLMLDQRARKRPVYAPFFGRLARCDRSAGALARRVGAPVLFYACTCEPEPFRYRMRVSKVLWPRDFRGLGPEGVAALVNRCLEPLVLATPEQYFWLHDRYKGVPEGASFEGIGVRTAEDPADEDRERGTSRESSPETPSLPVHREAR